MTGRFAALSLSMLLAACASPPSVKTDVNPAANFGSYRTYSWIAKAEGASPLVQQRIVDGIDAKLQAKGWRPVAANADVHVGAHVSSQQKQSNNVAYSSAGYGWDWGGFGPSATNTVTTYEVGTLVVDMFDARTRKAIWRGAASGTLQDDPGKMSALVQSSIDQMFAAFPPGSAAAR
ncbi:MAG: DUF4136 domain-containing protein [Variovorax sp.]|nr:MAG: DUF4136 domain-containing protein [Variovorax sp.]